MPPRKRAAEIADGDAESSVGGTGAAASVRGPRKKRARLFAPAAAEVNDSDRESTPAPAALVSFSSESPASFAGRTSAARLAAQKAFESRNRTPASSPAVRAPRRSGGGPPKPTEGPDFVEWGDDEGAPVRLSELPEWLDDLGYRFQQCSGAKKSKAGTPPFIVRYLGEDPRRRDPREVELAVDANPDAAPAAIAAAIEKGYRVAGFSFRCCGLPSCPPTGDACPFEMRIVIYANDIHRAHIFVRGYHPPPPQDERGRSSAILRRDAYAYFLRSGTTPASFLAEYAKEINDRGGIKLETLKAIAARARRNAVGAPTHALLLKLASDHPDTVCLINFDAEEGRLKQFACAFTSETGFVYAVLYWLYVGIDTSFRRKTSDRMPVTGLVAIDPNTGQGRPLTLLVSTNIRQPVLEAFLDWFRKRVRRFARDLLYKPRREWPVALRSARADVERAAEGWSPRCWVLDKSRAELNALKAIFGDDILCRLCTFHILQAFRRHEKVDHGEGDEEEEGAQEARPTETKIPNKIRKAVGRAFVDLCRRAVDDEDWDTRVKELLELTVPQIVQKHTQAGGHRADIVRSICFYLRRNWLCDLWKPLTARYLLPEDIDIKMIFTNNPTEAAWRVLDRVILRGSFHFITAIVKLMRVWDYCEARDRAGKRPLNRDVKKAMAEGLALWEAGHVVEVTPHRVFHVRRSNGDQAVVILGPVGTLSPGELPCSAPGCCGGNTSIDCKHYHAALQHSKMGPFVALEGAVDTAARAERASFADPFAANADDLGEIDAEDADDGSEAEQADHTSDAEGAGDASDAGRAGDRSEVEEAGDMDQDSGQDKGDDDDWVGDAQDEEPAHTFRERPEQDFLDDPPVHDEREASADAFDAPNQPQGPVFDDYHPPSPPPVPPAERPAVVPRRKKSRRALAAQESILAERAPRSPSPPPPPPSRRLLRARSPSEEPLAPIAESEDEDPELAWRRRLGSDEGLPGDRDKPLRKVDNRREQRVSPEPLHVGRKYRKPARPLHTGETAVGDGLVRTPVTLGGWDGTVSPVKANLLVYVASGRSLEVSRWRWADTLAALFPALFRACYPGLPRLVKSMLHDKTTFAELEDFARHWRPLPRHELSYIRDLLVHQYVRTVSDKVEGEEALGRVIQHLFGAPGSVWKMVYGCGCSTPAELQVKGGVLECTHSGLAGAQAQFGEDWLPSPFTVALFSLLDKAGRRRRPPCREGCRGQRAKNSAGSPPLITFAFESGLECDLPQVSKIPTIDKTIKQYRFVGAIYGGKNWRTWWLENEGDVWCRDGSGARIFQWIDRKGRPGVWEEMDPTCRATRDGGGSLRYAFYVEE